MNLNITPILFILLICSSCSELVVKDLQNFKLKYQLQNYNQTFLKESTESTKSLWVLDSYKSSGQLFTLYDLLRIKNNGNVVAAYLSLGEAESYRSYFNGLSKSLLLDENPHWKGNFTVKYWEKPWHDIIYKNKDSLIVKKIEQGFDGVFLDVVDVFLRFNDKEKKAMQMADLVISLSKRAKDLRSDFKIFLQNGTEIIKYLSEDKTKELFSAIDGASIEGYFFNYTKKDPELSDYFQKTYPAIIEQFKSHDKSIYLIEYVENETLKQQFFKFCDQYNLSCMITDRSLSGKNFSHNSKLQQ